MLPRALKPRFFDTLSNATGRYIKPEPYHKAKGLVAKVYKQVIDEFFINGPMTTHAIYPKLLAGVWMAEREILLADNILTREDKEALGVTISQVNGCTYCEDLINSVVYGAEEQELAELLRYHKQDEIKNDKTRQLHAWALSSYEQDAPILFNPPFSFDEAAEVIGTAFMLNYFNRYVRVFFAGTPLKVPFSSKIMKSVMYRLTGVELRESVTRRLEPGLSINFLEEAELPVDMQWAANNSVIAAAVSRWAAVMEQLAEKHIPITVRKIVESEVNAWQGEPMGLSRAWVLPKVAGLGYADTTAAQLALITALSPSQMSNDIVVSYKKYFDNTSLTITVAWAAFIASKRVAGWLADKSGYFEQQQLPLAS